MKYRVKIQSDLIGNYKKYKIKSLYDNINGETNRNIDAVRYENAKNTCDITHNAQLNTRDILEAQNAGFQRILDFLTNDKIDSLRGELQSAQLQLGNMSQTNTLINTLRPYPYPAYITCSPYVSSYGYGCGCNG